MWLYGSAGPLEDDLQGQNNTESGNMNPPLGNCKGNISESFLWSTHNQKWYNLDFCAVDKIHKVFSCELVKLMCLIYIANKQLAVISEQNELNEILQCWREQCIIKGCIC